jgi:hypothetical protein
MEGGWVLCLLLVKENWMVAMAGRMDLDKGQQIYGNYT